MDMGSGGGDDDEAWQSALSCRCDRDVCSAADKDVSHITSDCLLGDGDGFYREPDDCYQTVAASCSAVPATIAKEAVASGALTSWRSELLSQVTVRDRATSGIRELYEQYVDSLHSLRALRAVTGVCARGSNCPSPDAGSPPTGEDFELPNPGVDLQPLSKVVEASEQAKRLSQKLRCKTQEVEALQQMFIAREEELREKEGAHTTLTRQATLLGRENTELKAQLELAQAELRAKKSESERLATELQRMRKGARESSNVCNGPAALELPMCQLMLRKIHGAELSCIGAAEDQPAPLPISLVALGTADGYVKLVNGVTLRPHAHLSVARELPRVVAVDLSRGGDGKLLAASADHALRLLDLRGQKLVHTLRGHTGAISACGFVIGHQHAFTASADRTLKVWDLERAQALRSALASVAVTCATAHPRSSIIVAGHDDGSVAVWDFRVGNSLSASSSVHAAPISGLCISPDGRSLLSQADNGSLSITSLESMRPLWEFPGVAGLQQSGAAVATRPAFSPDGTHLIAHGANVISCWAATSGELVCKHETPADGQETAGVCWDLPQAVSLHRGGFVALWGIRGAAGSS